MKLYIKYDINIICIKFYYYKNKDREEPVKDYIEKLFQESSKDSRIKANKIRDYIKALSTYGLAVGQPYVKHLDGEIWELRPIRDRILFAAFRGDAFVLLHCFMKKTQKTPRKEIEIARKRLAEVMEEESL